jgi:hypothetical protein
VQTVDFADPRQLDTVDQREIQADSEPLVAAIGVRPTGIGPNNAYTGYRVKADDDPKIYLVMFGLRHWIPGERTYNNLFRDWSGVLRFPTTDALREVIPETVSLTAGACLAKSSDRDLIYLINENRRLWVSSPAVMDKFYFDWDKVVVVPDNIISSIPLGRDLI